MNSVSPAELSGLLDGELDPARAAEVLAMIAADPELQSLYDTFRRDDAGWRAQAASAAFLPRVRLPARRQPSTRWAAALFLAVLVAWVAGKLTDETWAFLLLNSLSLAGLTVAVFSGIAQRLQPAERMTESVGG